MHIAHEGAARAASATRPQPHMPAALRRRAEADAFVRASCIMARVNRLCERARNGFSKTCEAAKIGHHHFARLGGTRQNLAQSQQRRHRTQGRYEQPKQSPEPPPPPEETSTLPTQLSKQVQGSRHRRGHSCLHLRAAQSNPKTAEPQNHRKTAKPQNRKTTELAALQSSNQQHHRLQPQTDGQGARLHPNQIHAVVIAAFFRGL